MSTPVARFLRRLSKPAHSPEDFYAGPIRGELLGADHLAERARTLAKGQRPERRHAGRRSARLLNRLNATRLILDDAHNRLADAARQGVDVGPAGEWLLDNYHVVDEHVREVHQSLPRDYYRELPQLSAGPLRGYPRVYELAITLISHTEGRIDLENVDLFTSAYQEISPLSIGELWAVPAMLRLGLIESVRRMTLRTITRLDEIEEADRWATRIQSEHDEDPASLGYTFAEFSEDRDKLTPTFVARFLQQLRLNANAVAQLRWVEQWVAEHGVSPDDALARATERLALTSLMMSNSITSLRGIAQRDWRYFVEHQSAVEHVLRNDPANVYAQMMFETRDSYRHVVERIAKGTTRDERAVAQAAIDMARAPRTMPGERLDARRTHVGYYLVDRGADELEAALGYRPKFGEAIHRWVLRHPTIAFVGSIIALTVLALGTLFALGGEAAQAAWLAVLVVTFIPANDIAVNVVNQLVTAFLPPRVLPKLDLVEHGIPAEFRTAVVVPTLFDSVVAAREAVANLEVQYLANKDANLHFAVLSDFTDADTETRETDAAIVESASDAVRALNAKYASGTGDLFHLFHRPRKWNPSQGVWMGWERKRGKLAEFNRFLRGNADGAFSVIVGDVDEIRAVRFVITLDSDTLLPPGSAAALIGAIAHPLNRAVHDEVTRHVVDGYGILQPRVGVSLASANRSRFAAIHSGHPGVDPYTTAVSDVYQDLFGEGSFTGKGIYDLDAFEQATHGRFPENRLLSHDLIEGNYARAGLVTDITVYDDYPTRYVAHARRKHRWIRGDWQLLRWLTRRVPGPDGAEPNRLSVLSRWKILDNLRRSVVELAQLAMLVAGWTVLPGSPARWTLLALGAIAAPWIVAVLLASLRPPSDKSWRAYYGAVAQDAMSSVRQFATTLTFLPHQAWLSLDAIVRTLWRMGVSRRNLLEWQAAALAERAAAGRARVVWDAMWPAFAGVALVLGAVAAHTLSLDDPSRFVTLAYTALPIGVLWLASPVVAYALSIPFKREIAELTSASREAARRYARAHWEFFARFVTEESHWLAPDNFQEDPEPVLALRTSPTNIGLQLLSTVSACDMEIISPEEMTATLERVFDTLDRLARYHGHFYNWYDLRDLHVLEPGYVSTVDSGNLAGHLIALRQACLAYAARATPQLAMRLNTIAERARRFTQEMDFTILFDESRKLFAIGYNASNRRLDVSSYDLLASEARLASFLAIAKTDVPFEHWFRLGRRLTVAGGERVLVSWSGSMFEYLMPSLVMHSYPGTVLAETCAAAVTRQIRYGTERGVPWGVSESAYNVRDRHFTYQYRAFGVPDLGLKRGLARDLVVAPYASALAAMVNPEAAMANLALLESRGMLGEFGFYDAMDYTRVDDGGQFTIVRNYMAHHVGMTIVALANVLFDNRWQRRFHADPMVRAVALLLDERVPRKLEVQETQPERANEIPRQDDGLRPVVREVEGADTPEAHIALLGHAPFTAMLNHSGGGYLRYGDIAVIRWRADGTRDRTGHSCYVNDVTKGRIWSTAHQPVCAPADWYHARLATDRVSLHRTDGDIDTRTEIVVVPEDSAEVRRVTVTNNSSDVRDIELTSYGEIVMQKRMADVVHPAFGNLFVETEWHEWCTAITAARRPRSEGEPPLWCVHVVDTGRERVGPTTCETDRARFIGRGRSVRDPIAMEGDGPLSGTTGAVLDPIFALRTRVQLAPGQSASVAFTTLVATTREMAFKLADRYHHPHAAQRALDLAWTATQIELREFDFTPADAADFQDLAGRLLYPPPQTHVARTGITAAASWQQILWSNGISGDWPIVMATIEEAEGLVTLQQILTAHRYWRLRGMTVDLVIIDAEPHSYIQSMRDRINELILTTTGSTITEQPGGIFVRRRDMLDERSLATLTAVAGIQLECDGRALARVLNDALAPSDPDIYGEDETSAPRRGDQTPEGLSVVDRFRAKAVRAIGKLRLATGDPSRTNAGVTPIAGMRTHIPLQFDCGFGGLTTDGNYRVRVVGDHVPPAPWANVIANERGGFIVTERGGGFTWAQNSYFYRLTPWHNDPVCDPLSEVVYLRDEQSGDVWCPTPAPVRRDTEYAVEHAPGTTSFEYDYEGIHTKLVLGMVGDEPIKASVLTITNESDRPRRIAITSYAEWTLGVLREQTQYRVRTSFDARRRAIFARNHFDSQFSEWVAFSAISEKVTSHTGNRQEFLGRNGSLAYPAGLTRSALGSSTGIGFDPCAALQCVVELLPGASHDLLVILGAAPNEGEAQRLVDEWCDVGRARTAVDRTVEEWRRRLDVVRVHTPDAAFDTTVNRWSLYQALSCRMWARSAMYQSSGAFGFRDQLQDVMAFVYSEPDIARAHLIRAAARQFVEGDVQHWWHPETGRGVRTRFSDDLVWLAYVTDHYVRVTGDASVFDEEAPFLEMRPLEPHEHEVYDQPRVSEQSATLYEHCLRALKRACTEGPHGLPLIGTGDWNDGMNRVGADGRGESVWLAWFLVATLRSFAEHVAAKHDAPTAAALRDQADRYVVAVEEHGWDGEWYRRAYYDDGSILGSASNTECRIDSIAQSWSVISGAGRPERQDRAMASLEKHLVREDGQLLMLLTPPFHDSPQDPGYIKGYVPGVRENGAQYTHAALWAVLAMAQRGDGERAFKWFQMINPLLHADTRQNALVYKVEPYVVAADVYTTPGALGRGGWTWYTGSASWLYRVALEAIIGFKKRANTLRIAPVVPPSWPALTIEYRFGSSVYSITVKEPGLLRERGAAVTIDGREQSDDVIALADDGARHIVAIVPRVG